MKGNFCPECNHPLKLGARPHLGQRVTCAGCESKLTVINLEPVELDLIIAPTAAVGIRHKAQTVDAPCPACDSEVTVSARARKGQRVQCNRCRTILEVTNVDPIELDINLLPNLRHNHR